MSTKSHFIYEAGIEGYEEGNEPQSIFDKFVGYNSYLLLDNEVLKSVRMQGDYLFIETKYTCKLPEKFKICGDAILYFELDEYGLEIRLKGGHYITKKIIQNDYSNLLA